MIALGEAVAHRIELDRHAPRLVDRVVRRRGVGLFPRLAQHLLDVVGPQILGASALGLEGLDAEVEVGATVLVGLAVEVALVVVDEQARNVDEVAARSLLQVLERASQRVGRAAADVALILDRRHVSAQVDEVRHAERRVVVRPVVLVVAVLGIHVARTDDDRPLVVRMLEVNEPTATRMTRHGLHHRRSASAEPRLIFF